MFIDTSCLLTMSHPCASSRCGCTYTVLSCNLYTHVSHKKVRAHSAYSDKARSADERSHAACGVENTLMHLTCPQHSLFPCSLTSKHRGYVCTRVCITTICLTMQYVATPSLRHPRSRQTVFALFLPARCNRWPRPSVFQCRPFVLCAGTKASSKRLQSTSLQHLTTR
jgi:hypothetical protein